MNLLILASITVAELFLIILVLFFFRRLRKSEQVMLVMQNNQDELMERMVRNANLEQELVATFMQRQAELERLNVAMEERIFMLKKLLKQAEEISHSPYLLREVIMNSRKKGMNTDMIAHKTGLARDEIELILKKENLL